MRQGSTSFLVSIPCTLKELGIVLNFRTKEIDIDDIILLMRDISKLSNRAKIERAWMASNSVMVHEPASTLEATQRVIKILDAKYKKADLDAVEHKHCTHLNSSNQEKILKLLKGFEESLFPLNSMRCKTIS